MRYEKFDLIGYRKKIGAILPSTNTIAGPELSYLCPTGVSINFSDISVSAALAENGSRSGHLAAELRDNLPDGVSRICNRQPHILILALDEDLADESGEGGRFFKDLVAPLVDVPVIDPLAAISEAARALKIENVALVSPYSAAQHDIIRVRLDAIGISVTNDCALDCADLRSPARLSYMTLREQAKELAQGAGAILQLGSNLAFGRIAEVIEQENDLPVIAINQALLWCAIRTLRITDKMPGVGRLLTRQMAS